MGTPDPNVLTPGGERLAQHYAHAMDLVHRCQRAAEEGNWVLLSDQAGALSTAADELSSAAAFVTTEAMPTSPTFMLAAAERLTSPEG